MSEPGGRLTRLRDRTRALRAEVSALLHALQDRRTPWAAKALGLAVLAYALSPIDLIPDFIPILGYLDDLVIVPAGLALTIRLIPPEVMVEARAKAEEQGLGSSLGRAGAAVILVIWLLAVGFLVRWIAMALRR